MTALGPEYHTATKITPSGLTRHLSIYQDGMRVGIDSLGARRGKIVNRSPRAGVQPSCMCTKSSSLGNSRATLIVGASLQILLCPLNSSSARLRQIVF